MNLEYNSQREHLIDSEYGRHVQNLLTYAKSIKEKDERQLTVERIVVLMQQVLPNAKPSKELTDKLWNHAFLIANYELDVEAPDDVEIIKKDEDEKPPRMDYPAHMAKYRHYGYNVQQLINKAAEVDDPEMKRAFANAIGSYMKLAYRTWHGDQHVSDEVIKEDLRGLSDGDLSIDESTPLNFLYQGARKRKRGAGQGRPKKKMKPKSKNRYRKKKY